MKNHSIFVAGLVILAGLLVMQDASLAQGNECDNADRAPKTHKLKINANNKSVTHDNGANADEVDVCIGDQVEWKLVGTARRFSVDFAFENGAPFAGAKKREAESNGKIVVTIGGPAKRGEEYDYNVGVDDAIADPKIRIG